MTEREEIIADAKQWVEQERVWDDMLYATPGTPQSPVPSSRQVVSRDPAALTSTPLDPGLQSAGVTSKRQALQALYEKYKDCVRCPLGPTRIKIVFGVGNAESVLFIGEIRLRGRPARRALRRKIRTAAR